MKAFEIIYFEPETNQDESVRYYAKSEKEASDMFYIDHPWFEIVVINESNGI